MPRHVEDAYTQSCKATAQPCNEGWAFACYASCCLPLCHSCVLLCAICLVLGFAWHQIPLSISAMCQVQQMRYFGGAQAHSIPLKLSTRSVYNTQVFQHIPCARWVGQSQKSIFGGVRSSPSLTTSSDAFGDMSWSPLRESAPVIPCGSPDFRLYRALFQLPNKFHARMGP